MTTLVLRAVAVGLPKVLQAAIGSVANFLSLLDRAFEARKTWERLNVMNDTQLAKIGIAREDIFDTVRKTMVSRGCR